LPRGLIVTLIQRSAAQGVVGTVAIARLTHFFAASGDEKGRATHRSRNRRFDQNFFAHKLQRTAIDVLSALRVFLRALCG
jgi:hypothetical protein